MAITYIGYTTYGGNFALGSDAAYYWNKNYNNGFQCPGPAGRPYYLREVAVYAARANDCNKTIKLGVYTSGGSRIYESAECELGTSLAWVGVTGLGQNILTGNNYYKIAVLEIPTEETEIYIGSSGGASGDYAYEFASSLPATLPAGSNISSLLMLRMGVEPVNQTYQEYRSLTANAVISCFAGKIMTEQRLVIANVQIKSQAGFWYNEQRLVTCQALISCIAGKLYQEFRSLTGVASIGEKEWRVPSGHWAGVELKG